MPICHNSLSMKNILKFYLKESFLGKNTDQSIKFLYFFILKVSVKENDIHLNLKGI